MVHVNVDGRITQMEWYWSRHKGLILKEKENGQLLASCSWTNFIKVIHFFKQKVKMWEILCNNQKIIVMIRT